MKPATLATVTFFALLSSELIDAAVHMQAGTTRKPGSLALCEREGQEIVGEKSLRLGTRTGKPKKLRNVVPDYPELPKGTTVRVVERGWAKCSLTRTERLLTSGRLAN